MKTASSLSAWESPEHNLVHLFTRIPIAGLVKTRLIPELGAEGALEACWTLLGWMSKRLLCKQRWQNHLRLAGLKQLEENSAATAIKQHLFALFNPQDYDFLPQCQGSLGAKLNQAFACSGKKHLVVGGDCVSVNPSLLSQAFEVLELVDVCISPAQDGGFCLMGARNPIPGFEIQVRFGTEYAYQDVLNLCERQHLSVQLLETGFDVDTYDDWLVFLRLMSSTD